MTVHQNDLTAQANSWTTKSFLKLIAIDTWRGHVQVKCTREKDKREKGKAKRFRSKITRELVCGFEKGERERLKVWKAQTSNSGLFIYRDKPHISYWHKRDQLTVSSCLLDGDDNYYYFVFVQYSVLYRVSKKSRSEAYYVSVDCSVTTFVSWWWWS